MPKENRKSWRNLRQQEGFLQQDIFPEMNLILISSAQVKRPAEKTVKTAWEASN